MNDQALLGHNGGPEIDGRKPTLRTMWARALFDDPDTPSYVMAIAWAIHWYSRKDGTGAALSNEQLMHICGVSEDTATKGKKWLRDNGYVELQVGNGRTKTQFVMRVPTAEQRAELRTQWNANASATVRVRAQRTLEGPVTADAEGGSQRRVGPRAAGAGSAEAGNIYRNYIPDRFRNNQRAPREGGNGAKGNYWNQTLNPHDRHSADIQCTDGKLVLVNGTRSKWLLEFGDDVRRLDLALIQVAGLIQPNSSKPLAVQVEAHLARLAAEKHDKDKRYASAAQTNRRGGAQTPADDGLTPAQRKLRAAAPAMYDRIVKGKPDAR